MPPIHAYASAKRGAALTPFDYDPGALGPDEVEIAVAHCGLCHSDLSMLSNSWGQTKWPLVPGHEVVGTVAALGANVRGLALGDRVGTGWFSASCMRCDTCLAGLQNLCASAQGIIVGRHGGFADRVRVHWSWAIPLPEGLKSVDAGPLFCAGITVFGPIAHFGVKPTDRVGVIGIGGLGHMAVQFLAKWGCEVTAFTSSADKAEQAKRLGAHHVVNSRDGAALDAVAGSFDFILSTVNVSLDWNKYLSALRVNGRLHVVGAVLEPMQIPAFALIGGQKSVSGSPLGGISTLKKMLEFCARHDIGPVTEHYALSDVNEAIAHLEAGKARYRVVLDV